MPKCHTYGLYGDPVNWATVGVPSCSSGTFPLVLSIEEAEEKD
jgi:hypothetical protein